MAPVQREHMYSWLRSRYVCSHKWMKGVWCVAHKNSLMTHCTFILQMCITFQNTMLYTINKYNTLNFFLLFICSLRILHPDTMCFYHHSPPWTSSGMAWFGSHSCCGFLRAEPSHSQKAFSHIDLPTLWLLQSFCFSSAMLPEPWVRWSSICGPVLFSS